MGLVIIGRTSFKSSGYDTANNLEKVPNAEPGEIISLEKFLALREFVLRVIVENRRLKSENEKLKIGGNLDGLYEDVRTESEDGCGFDDIHS